MGFPPLEVLRLAVKRHWPFLFALGIFAIITAVLWGQILEKNGGRFVYTLDDPYIHMAIAKNVVWHGVWGVTSYQFSSSTSSPLWTLFLALFYAIFGVSEILPFLLNLLLAVGAITLVYGLLHGRLPGWLVFLVLLAIIFGTPLAPMVFSGMEHTAQIGLTLSTVALAVRALTEAPIRRKTRIGLLVSAFLLVGVRYEGLFLILVLGILFACRKRWSFAFQLVGAGALPVCAYGVWSLAHRWYFLPNPVLLKGTGPNRMLIEFLKNTFLYGHLPTWQAIEHLKPVLFINRTEANPHILFLALASLCLLALRIRQFWTAGSLTNAAFLGTALLHMQFASTGWFFRYEAYLVAFGIFAIAAQLAELSPMDVAPRAWGNRLVWAGSLLLLGIFFSFPLRARAASSLAETPQASHNIFEQQIQMAAFLRQYYQGQVVAANDIGAIDFLADIRLVDLAGLGTTDSAAFQLKGVYGAPQVASVAERYHAQIALVYDSWFSIPSGWIKAGEWQIPDNVVCGDSTVSFYAINPEAAPGLIEHLRSFQARLPADVIQRGY